jgi:hypothetical protein
MRAKHTPGPWLQVGAWVEVERDDIPDICTCNPRDIGQDHLKWNWKTVHANARLIAAAPDLLEALNAMLTHMGMDEDEWNKPTFDQARAAIAKATGATC